MAHRWTRNDDIVIFYLYKYSENDIGLSQNEIANRLGISESSLKMRLANFKAIDGQGGLKNTAKISKIVYSEFSQIPKEVHLKNVQQILTKEF